MRIIQNLARAQRQLLRAADAVPPDLWKTSPGDGRWSAGELVGHLIMVERAITGRADKLLDKPPKSPPFFRRFHVPMVLVEYQWFQLIASHELRHTKQMREIVTSLPKTVRRLQK